jgi:hypothetical protein
MPVEKLLSNLDKPADAVTPNEFKKLNLYLHEYLLLYALNLHSLQSVRGPHPFFSIIAPHCLTAASSFSYYWIS